jgi:hypothetical protein
MTKRKAASVAKPSDGLVPPGGKPTLEVQQAKGENAGRTLARVAVDPTVRHAFNIGLFTAGMLGKDGQPDLMETAPVLGEQIASVVGGDLALASRILVSQAVSLDAMFTELARRSSLNMGDYLDASDRYMRLALKAQSNCRATLEALAKLHQPREQTVKHVHVNDGGKAVVADSFHQHTGGQGNAENAGQPQATGQAGASAALPGPNPLGDGVPIARREGEAAMQDARRA